MLGFWLITLHNLHIDRREDKNGPEITTSFRRKRKIDDAAISNTW